MDIVGQVIEITKEATDLARLNHPHIIQYIDSFRDGNFFLL